MNRRNTIGLAAALAAVLGIGAATGAAAIIHVPGDYPTIQAAINAAANGDEVVVAPGTYYENINFFGKAITVRSSGGAPVTTIDGGTAARAITMNSGEPAGTVLDGFTITGQRGGVYIWNSSPTVQNCQVAGCSESSGAGGGGALVIDGAPLFANTTFAANASTADGGAAFCLGYGLVRHTEFRDCVFSANSSQLRGGAIKSNHGQNRVTVTRCTFTGNSALIDGGAIAFDFSNLASVTDCQFVDNTAGFGGAVYLLQQSQVTFSGCSFTENASTQTFDGGGALAVRDNSIASVSQCTFTNNTGHAGGAVFICCGGSVTASSCTFAGNHAGERGGAIFSINPETRLTVERCTFVNNSSGSFGGGVEVHQSDECLFKNCRFVGNSSGYGAGLHTSVGTMSVDGCVFSDNIAQQWGGGSAIRAELFSSGSRVTSCTIVNNIGPSPWGAVTCLFPGSTLEVSNCVLYENRSSPGGPLEHFGGGGTFGVSYSLVQGGYPGEGNIDADPLFYDPENGDYRPAAGSPCIDAGSNALVPPGLTTDIDGWPRIVDGNADGTATVDMGAYEAQDCNGNSVPDFQDILSGTSTDLNENEIPDDCEDQSCTNLTTGQTYPTIAAAIAAAQNGHHLRAAPLAYTITPTIDFAGKQVLLDSSGEIVQPTVGLINMTNNADLATAAGQGLTLRGTLRSANNATADVTAGSLTVVENATLRARLASTLSIETTAGSTLGGTTYVEANATLNFTGPVTNTATVTTVTNATFSALDGFVNAGTFGTLQSNVVLATATNTGTMNLPNVLLLADQLINAEAGQLAGYGQLYTNLTNAGDLTIVGNTTIVGDVLNETTGLIVLQLGTTTLVGTLTNNGGLVGQFRGRSGALDIVGDFVAGPGATLSIPAGSGLSVTGHYDVAINDSSRYAMAEATLQLRGAARTQYLEVMSLDRGPSPDGLDPELAGSYPLGTLHIGPSAAVVQLVDNHDNDGQGQAACEAIYADTVLIDAGTTLINPTCKVYYSTLVNEGTVTHPGNLIHIGEVVPGDLNCDGAADGFDIQPFVLALTDPDAYELAYPDCNIMNADCNGDGAVDGFDIQPFVAILTGG